MSMSSPQGERNCEICGQPFENEAELEAHLRRSHDAARRSEDAGGTVEGTEGGASRVQTE